MSDWIGVLRRRGTLILDGAWGTQMIRLGLKAGTCPESWNLDRPDSVRAVARSYREAGADIVLTNSFGGNSFKLRRAGVEANVYQLNLRAVQLSRGGAPDALIFASIGPTGEFLEPLGAHTEDKFIGAFSEQVRAFVAGGADGVVIETMSDVRELTCALRAVRRHSDLPVAACMSFSPGKRGFATLMGTGPVEVAETLTQAGADIVGSNCGSGIDDLVEIARLMRSGTNRPLWIKPNAGVPELHGGKVAYHSTPEDMARRVPDLVATGVSFIGGCCGTTPQHIKLMAEAAATHRDAARRRLQDVVFRGE